MRSKNPSLLSPNRELAIALVMIVAGVARICLGLWSTAKANGAPGFPLDDPWIHLQFAKNLHDFGSFSYFRNDMVTAGSTSPLYTMIAALGFFFTSNEMLLANALGITFFAVAGGLFFLLLRALFPERPLLAMAGLLLFLLDPRMEWAALSGMETTLFIAGLIAALYCFARRWWRMLGLALGVLLWIRPEALALTVLLGAGALATSFLGRAPADLKSILAGPRSSLRELRIPALILAAFAAAYLLFNYRLSGSPFPNTFAAKISYYSGGSSGFPAKVLEFLSGGHMLALAVLALIGALAGVRDFLRARRVEPLVFFGWITGMFLAYWWDLPFLYQEGRYLMPVLPAVILLAVFGVSAAGDFLRRFLFPKSDPHRENPAHIALVLVPVVQFAFGIGPAEKVYAEQCRYINDRQVRTAYWLRDHLPETAVIGTHDIGAIGFYSGRRVVDMAGLVSPDLIAHLHNLDSLEAFLARKRVTHLAVLRTWFEIVNINPLFQTDENHPEIMEVFPFDRARVHFVPGNACRLEQLGLSYLARGEGTPAIAIFGTAIRMDPLSSRLHLYHGLALLSGGRAAEAEGALRRALEIQPDLWNAEVGLAQVEAARGRANDAIARLRGVLARNPDVVPAYAVLGALYANVMHDTAGARVNMEEYRRRSQGSTP